VGFGSKPAQTVTSDGGSPSTALGYDPIGGGGDACKQTAAEHASGTAVYEGDVSKGYTLMGFPTVTAHIVTSGQFGQLDSRLWDVGPDGKQTLIARGVYRLLDNQQGDIVFQLHGNGWRFAQGHKPKLELLGRDAPYVRASNGSFSIQVSNVTVELPTLEKPGAAGGQVGKPKANRIHVSVRPRHPRTGATPSKLIFYVWTAPGGHKHAVKGARVNFAHHTAKTNKRGRATMRVRFRRAGKRRAVVTQPGLQKSVLTVRVLRSRR
jgi:predicted acyl esterase